MKEDKKEGILSKIFGQKKSSCCNLRIEEVEEDEKKEANENKQEQNKPSWCGDRAKKDM